MKRMEQVPTGLKHILQAGKKKVNVSPQNQKRGVLFQLGKKYEVTYTRDQSLDHYCS
jgi:hypothetical protein